MSCAKQSNAFAASMLATVTVLSPAQAADKLSFQLSPYIWLANAEARAVAPSANDSVILEIGAFDLINNIKLGGMVAAELRYGDFGVIADAAYGEFVLAGDLASPAFSGTTLDLNAWVGNVYLTYRLFDTPGLSTDLIGGVRIISPEILANIDVGGQSVSVPFVDKTYLDPVVGIRVNAPLTDRFSLHALADLGGFDVSSETTWQVYTGVAIRINNSIDAQIGYRNIDWNFSVDETDVLHEISGSGPLIGLQFEF